MNAAIAVYANVQSVTPVVWIDRCTPPASATATAVPCHQRPPPQEQRLRQTGGPGHDRLVHEVAETGDECVPGQESKQAAGQDETARHGPPTPTTDATRIVVAAAPKTRRKNGGRPERSSAARGGWTARAISRVAIASAATR